MGTQDNTDYEGHRSRTKGLQAFIRDALGFLVLQCLVLAAVLTQYPVAPDDYLSAMDSKTSLLQDGNGGRLVLVGGSNMAFGLSCDQLRDGTGREVVNLGLHAGVGLNVMLRQAESGIGTGDVVVVSLEYEHFDRRLGEELWPTLVEHQGIESDWLSWDDGAALLDNVRYYLSGALRRTALSVAGRYTGPNALYRASSFDRQGCIVPDVLESPEDVSSRRYFGGSYSGLRLNWALAQLSHFAENMKDKGATVVFVHPPTLESAYKPAQVGLEAIHKRLLENGFTVLSKPEEAVLPDRLFYDTEYHLGPEGQQRRTAWLIAHLAEQAGLRD